MFNVWISRAGAVLVALALFASEVVAGTSADEVQRLKAALDVLQQMTGGSVGWQIGLQAVDVVLVVMNREGVDKLLKSEFTLGANASVAAGPVGRGADASTDALMHAKILAYSRARGLFAGATVEGTSLRSDDGANRDFYGREVSAVEVVGRGGSVPAILAAGQEWRDGLARLVGPARAAR